MNYLDGNLKLDPTLKYRSNAHLIFLMLFIFVLCPFTRIYQSVPMLIRLFFGTCDYSSCKTIQKNKTNANIDQLLLEYQHGEKQETDTVNQ